jgi:hypothetical protein
VPFAVEALIIMVSCGEIVRGLSSLYKCPVVLGMGIGGHSNVLEVARVFAG